MNSKVTYLSSRSLAAYETMLIESYAQQYKRDARMQMAKVFLVWTAFVGMAFLALILPLFVTDFVRLAWF